MTVVQCIYTVGMEFDAPSLDMWEGQLKETGVLFERLLIHENDPSQPDMRRLGAAASMGGALAVHITHTAHNVVQHSGGMVAECLMAEPPIHFQRIPMGGSEDPDNPIGYSYYRTDFESYRPSALVETATGRVLYSGKRGERFRQLARLKIERET